MNELLREYIRFLLEKSKKIITEPDNSEGPESEEASGAAAVAGVTTPLGTGPNYPKKSKKRKHPAAVASKNFANARPVKIKRSP